MSAKGFEPLTVCLEGRCSIQLSYAPLKVDSRLVNKRIKKVGAAGFEPATSWSQTRRDDRTTLRPEYIRRAEGKGFEPLRHFRVDSLANCSVNHSGNPPFCLFFNDRCSVIASANIEQISLFTK